MTTPPPPGNQRRRTFGLGLLHRPDERDQLYQMEAVLGASPHLKRHTERFYQTAAVLDQGDTSMCVGYSTRQFLSSAPLMTRSGPSERDIYVEAQRRDPWAHLPHEGTTFRAALGWLKELGHIAAYYWATDPQPAIDWVLTDQGTVLIGTPWTRRMFSPERIEDGDGGDYVVRVGPVNDPNNPNIGGHAYLIVGYSTERGAFRVYNSWGAAWGKGGRAWLPVEELKTLYQLGPVELVTAVEARV